MVTKALSVMSAPRRIRSAEVKKVIQHKLKFTCHWTKQCMQHTLILDARPEDVIRIEDCHEILKEEVELDG